MAKRESPIRRDRRTTLRDVAERARVSVATVSYVVNRAPQAARVGAATRERVLAAVADLGYVPDQAARTLRRSRTGRICLSLPRLGVPFYDALAGDLQRAAADAGYQLIIALGPGVDGADAVLTQLRGGLADGLVMVLEHEARAELAPRLAELGRAGVGAVVFGTGLEPDGFDVVADTDAEACRAAVAWLLARGHRRVGCLALRLGDGRRHHRWESYRRALADAGLEPDPALVRDGAGDRTVAYAATHELLRLPEPPSALFACTDVAALSAIRAARDAGLGVPGDLAVVGAGDIVEGEAADPALTTVGPETRDFRDVAALVLERLRASEPLPGRRIVKRWELKERSSA